jgi:hypothetical protein
MKGVVIKAGGSPCFFMSLGQLCGIATVESRLWDRGCGTATASASLGGLSTTPPPMRPEAPQRPPWLNWLFLLAFLWSSYQLAGLWFQRLHG